MRILILLICLSGFTRISGEIKLSPEEEEGKKIYTLNCMACHALDQMIVGPSLVEIAHLHRKKPEGIVIWSMNPQQKRPGVIEMPPMSHLGEANLKKVAAYILKVTKGKKFVKKKSGKDPFAQFPFAKIQRTFMPNAGPAAIAVSLTDQLHLCWDAGTCQFRYAWTGAYIDNYPVLRGNGNGLAKVKGQLFSNVTAGNPFKSHGKVKYHGYKKENGLPVFLYRVGSLKIESRIKAASTNAVSFTYSVSGASGDVKFQPAVAQGKWSSDKGKIDSGTLTLSAKDAASFTVTFSGEAK